MTSSTHAALEAVYADLAAGRVLDAKSRRLTMQVLRTFMDTPWMRVIRAIKELLNQQPPGSGIPLH